MAYIPAEYADLMFVLLGERPLQANSDLALQFSELLHWSADQVREMKVLLAQAQHHQLQDALPHDVAEGFSRVLGEYTGIDGSGYLDVFSEELDRLGVQVAGLSLDIEEAHREIIAELFLLASTLAALSALGFFTGGFSFSQMAWARALTRLNIMRRLSGLVMLGALVEGVYQGLEEALTQLAVQLSMMIPAPFNPESRRRTEVDWKKVGQDLFIGSLMGVFTHGLDHLFKPLVNVFKDSAPWKRLLADESANFLSTGTGESLAELLGLGILNGTWEFNADTFLGAGLSSVVTGNIGKGLFTSFKHISDLTSGTNNPYNNPAGLYKQPPHTTVINPGTTIPAPQPYGSAGPDLPHRPGIVPPTPLTTLNSGTGTPQPHALPGPDLTNHTDYTDVTGPGSVSQPPAPLHTPDTDTPQPHHFTGPDRIKYESPTDLNSPGAIGSLHSPAPAGPSTRPTTGPSSTSPGPSPASGSSSTARPQPLTGTGPGSTPLPGTTAPVPPTQDRPTSGTTGVFPADAPLPPATGITDPAPTDTPVLPATGPAVPPATGTDGPHPSPARGLTGAGPQALTTQSDTTAATGTVADTQEPAARQPGQQRPASASTSDTTVTGPTTTPPATPSPATPSPTPPSASTPALALAPGNDQNTRAGQGPAAAPSPRTDTQADHTPAPGPGENAMDKAAQDPGEADTTALSPEATQPSAAPGVTDGPTSGNDWNSAWDAATVTLHEHDITVPGPDPNPLDETSRPESMTVHSVLEVRRFDYAGHPVTDVTLRIQFTNPDLLTPEQHTRLWDNVSAAAERFNSAGLLTPDRDLFHLTVLDAAAHPAAHQRYQRTTLTAQLGQDSTATTWHLQAATDDLHHALAQLTGFILNGDGELLAFRPGFDNTYTAPPPRPRTTSQDTHPVLPDDHTHTTPRASLTDVGSSAIDANLTGLDGPATITDTDTDTDTDLIDLDRPTLVSRPKPMPAAGSDHDSPGTPATIVTPPGHAAPTPVPQPDTVSAAGTGTDQTPLAPNASQSTPSTTQNPAPATADRAETDLTDRHRPTRTRPGRDDSQNTTTPLPSNTLTTADSPHLPRADEEHTPSPSRMISAPVGFVAEVGGYEPGTPSGDDTDKLDVARWVGTVLNGLGYPVVLAGAARGRVQFGQSRPLGAVEFQLPAATLSALADIRGALEREMPGASVRVWPVTGGAHVLGLWVNGVDITVTAVNRPSPPSGTVTVDGFILPQPGESLAEAALVLATGTDPELRGRDLLDLLWALHRTSADGSRTLTPVLAREDAYRSARPTGAADYLAVRLSELLDSVALDFAALARYEETWRALGATDASLPALRAELTKLADGLRARPEVTADQVRALAARLPGMTSVDREAALASLPPADRERLAGDPVLVDALRAELASAEFASVAARLMTQVPDGVEQPVSAGDRARAQIARLLQDSDVAARLLKGGSRVVVVPRGEAMTSLDAFRFLRGAITSDGRPWETVRGASLRTAAVTEENLIGEHTTIPNGESAQADGYSTTVHEVAHIVHLHGLDAGDRKRITDAYRSTEQAGESGFWPDGPLYSRDAEGRRSAPNYSSRDELEFFAQLTNVYLMANGGSDPYTGLPRNNAGPEWVRTRQPALYPLLRRLYGEGPRMAPRHPRSVEPARPRGMRPADVNPVEATDVENEALARARALWDVAEGGPGDGSDPYVAVRALWDGTTGGHTPQPHAPAPLPFPTQGPGTSSAAASPPTDSAVQQRIQELWDLVDATFGSQPLSQELRTGLFNSLRVIEAARAGHRRFGVGLDLEGITRMLLHLAPDVPVDAALHYDALTLASSAHRRGRSSSLDAIAAYALTRQGYSEQSVLRGDDGAPYGRNWTNRRSGELHMDVVADAQGVHPAPWRPAAHAVVAERNVDGAVLANGRPVSDEEFAELVLHDPQRQPDVPMVVLIEEGEDGRNETLARVIADRTGTRVWFTYGDLRLVMTPTGRRVPFLATPAFGSAPAGTWVPADPGLVPDDPAATVHASIGTFFPDADIHSYPLVTVDGQNLTGRAFLSAHDMAIREEALRVVSTIQHYINEYEGLPGVYAGWQGNLLPLPRGLANSYVFVGHGDHGRTTVPRRSTRANQAIHPKQLGRILARRKSLQTLSLEQPVWLVGCDLSMTRIDQDLLTHPVSAQYIANETRRTVFAVDRKIAPSEAEGSLPPRLVLIGDRNDPVGHVAEILPEPRTVALDALADLGGLPGQLPDRADRARRWVRALRQTHGVHFDSDLDREAEFHELIEGFGALERLRFQAAGNADPGLLTWGGLRHIVGRYAAGRGWDRSLTAGSLAHLLHAARAGRLQPSDAAGPSAPAAPQSNHAPTTPEQPTPVAAIPAPSPAPHFTEALDPVIDRRVAESFADRRPYAPLAHVVTEIFHPAADPLASRTEGRLAGTATQIAMTVRRVQAPNGTWVRDLSVTLPVAFGEGFSNHPGPENTDLANLKDDLNKALDTHINHQFLLPLSKDQLHISVHFVHQPDHRRAVTLTRSGRPGRSSQTAFHLHVTGPDGHLQPQDTHLLVHEILHYTGVTDRYHDTATLFRAGNRNIHSTGLMAADATPQPKAIPTVYLTQIETATTSGPPLHDHPYTPSAPQPTTTHNGYGTDLTDPTPIPPAAQALLDAAAEELLQRTDQEHTLPPSRMFSALTGQENFTKGFLRPVKDWAKIIPKAGDPRLRLSDSSFVNELEKSSDKLDQLANFLGVTETEHAQDLVNWVISIETVPDSDHLKALPGASVLENTRHDIYRLSREFGIDPASLLAHMSGSAIRPDRENWRSLLVQADANIRRVFPEFIGPHPGRARLYRTALAHNIKLHQKPDFEGFLNKISGVHANALLKPHSAEVEHPLYHDAAPHIKLGITAEQWSSKPAVLDEVAIQSFRWHLNIPRGEQTIEALRYFAAIGGIPDAAALTRQLLRYGVTPTAFYHAARTIPADPDSVIKIFRTKAGGRIIPQDIIKFGKKFPEEIREKLGHYDTSPHYRASLFRALADSSNHAGEVRKNIATMRDVPFDPQTETWAAIVSPAPAPAPRKRVDALAGVGKFTAPGLSAFFTRKKLPGQSDAAASNQPWVNQDPLSGIHGVGVLPYHPDPVLHTTLPRTVSQPQNLEHPSGAVDLSTLVASYGTHQTPSPNNTGTEPGNRPPESPLVDFSTFDAFYGTHEIPSSAGRADTADVVSDGSDAGVISDDDRGRENAARRFGIYGPPADWAPPSATTGQAEATDSIPPTVGEAARVASPPPPQTPQASALQRRPAIRLRHRDREAATDTPASTSASASTSGEQRGVVPLRLVRRKPVPEPTHGPLSDLASGPSGSGRTSPAWLAARNVATPRPQDITWYAVADVRASVVLVPDDRSPDALWRYRPHRFDLRRFTVEGSRYTDIALAIHLTDSPDSGAIVTGIQNAVRLLNDQAHRAPDGSKLTFTVTVTDQPAGAHLTLTPVQPTPYAVEAAAHHINWPTTADIDDYVHLLTEHTGFVTSPGGETLTPRRETAHLYAINVNDLYNGVHLELTNARFTGTYPTREDIAKYLDRNPSLITDHTNYARLTADIAMAHINKGDTRGLRGGAPSHYHNGPPHTEDHDAPTAGPSHTRNQAATAIPAQNTDKGKGRQDTAAQQKPDDDADITSASSANPSATPSTTAFILPDSTAFQQPINAGLPDHDPMNVDSPGRHTEPAAGPSQTHTTRNLLPTDLQHQDLTGAADGDGQNPAPAFDPAPTLVPEPASPASRENPAPPADTTALPADDSSGGDAAQDRTGSTGQRGEPGGERQPDAGGKRRPWYFNSDALGDAWVSEADHPEADETDLSTAEISAATHREGDRPELSAGIRDGVQELLSVTDAKQWDALLRRGRHVVADGRLVWLRPVLRDAVPLDEETGAVREYAVGFSTSKVGRASLHSRSRSFEASLLTFLSIGSKIVSTLLPAFPVLGMGLTGKAGAKNDWTLISGRKMLVQGNEPLRAGLTVRVFVDGVEREHDVVLPLRLTVRVPASHVTTEEPRPDLLGAPAPWPGTNGKAQRSTGTREVLNAVDLIPVTAELQRTLRTQKQLPAAAVMEIVTAAQSVLNEQSLRNSSRALFTHGIVLPALNVPVGARKSFRGHMVIRADLDSLQYLGDISAAGIRDDQGIGITTAQTREWTSKGSLGMSFNALGWTASGTGTGTDADQGSGQRASGLGPAAKVVFKPHRSTGHGLTGASFSHTVLNSSDPLSRYRSRLRIVIETESPTHAVPTVSRHAESEVAVPRREAPRFERALLGRQLDGPVAAQPHVRALMRIADLRIAPDAFIRPRSLDAALPAPHPREPLPLATRRGLGFGESTLLPGSELVLDQLRTVLRERVAAAGKASADWSTADRELDMWFARPALEADVSRLIAGFDRTVRVGGRTYQLGVKAHLRKRISGSTYPLVVNARSQKTAAVAGHRKKTRGWKVNAGGGLRLKLRSWALLSLGTAGASAEYRTIRADAFTGTAKSYRRTETTGNVDEHVYQVVYELTVQDADDSAPHTWWIDGARHRGTVARIVVPEEHVPSGAPDDTELATAGAASELASWPQGDAADFAGGGASGVYPAFLVMPELTRLAADLYAESNGQPLSTNPMDWPGTLKDVTSPEHLAAEFASLTSPQGLVVGLPAASGGGKRALRLRVRGYRPRHQGANEAEVEQYEYGGYQHAVTRGGAVDYGVSASLGPQFQLGSDKGDVKGASPADDQDENHGPKGPGGRVMARATAEADRETEHETEVDRGFIDISRATYGGAKHTFRMDPVFEVTLFAWRGAVSTERSHYLRVTDGLDVLVPERRLPALKLEAPGTDPVLPDEPSRHAHPGLESGSGFAEQLDADAVLDHIVEHLQAQGVLRTERAGAAPRPNLLRRLLTESFSTEALRSQWTTLRTDGVQRFIPVQKSFGGGRELMVRVKAHLGPAVAQAPRPDVKLMLRTEGLHEIKHKEMHLTGVGGRLDAMARGGAGVGHSGLEGAAGYTVKSSEAEERLHKTLDIARANFRGESYATDHTVTFTVEIALRDQLPELPDLMARGLHASYRSMRTLISGREAAVRWSGGRAPVWHHITGPRPAGAGVRADGGGASRAAKGKDRAVEGSVRLLLPEHLMVEGPAQPVPGPVLGSDPAWEGRQSGPTGDAAVSASERAALHKLIDNLHPWSLPAGAAIARWAALPAAPFRPPADLSASDAWYVPGLDATTFAGRRYENATGNILRSRVTELLRGTYTVPVFGDEVTVELRITGMRAVPGIPDVQIKGRRYTQDIDGEEQRRGGERGWYAALGPEAGGEADEHTKLAGALPLEYERGSAEDRSAERNDTDERNKESVLTHRAYAFDTELFLTGRHGTIRLSAPEALYGTLPLEKDTDGTLVPAGNLERSLARFLQNSPLPLLETESGASELAVNSGKDGHSAQWQPGPATPFPGMPDAESLSDGGSVEYVSDDEEMLDPLLLDQLQLALAETRMDKPAIWDALGVLREAMPRNFTGQQGVLSWEGLSELARTFLDQPTGTDSAEAVKELFLMVHEAQLVERADNLTAILAHHLETQGAYDDNSLITGTDGRPVGRDWNDGFSPRVVDLQTVAVVESGDHGASTLVEDTVGAAPWPEGTRFYRIHHALRTAPDNALLYRIRTSKGAWWVAGDVVAELVDKDPARTPGAQLLLLGSQDLNLSRAVAAAAGTPVWSATGAAALHTNDTSGTANPVRIRTAARDRPVGQWAVSPPDLSLPLGMSGEISGQYLYDTAGGIHWVRDADLVTHPIVDPVTHESIGRAVFTADEMASREAPYAEITSRQESFLTDPAYLDINLVGRETTPWTNPPPGTTVYVFAGHHDGHGRFWWWVRSGDHVVRMWGKPRSAGGYLKRRPSLKRMRQRAQGQNPHLLILHCSAGSAPVGSLVQETAPSAQILANQTGHPVYACATTVATSNIEPQVLTTFATSRGEPEGWKEYRPEPADAALEDLAVKMGLHTGTGPAPEEVMDTAKRLIVVLRQVFGPSAEDDDALVAGIGALERLRQADTLLTHTGPFALGFLTYASQALHQAENQQIPSPKAGTTDSAAAHRALLHKATLWLSSATADGDQRAPSLSDHLPMPHVQKTPAPLPEYQVEMVLAPIDFDRKMAAPAVHFGSDAERHAVAYWSIVRAQLSIDAYGGPTDDLVRAVLHLPSDRPVTDHLKWILTQCVAQSFAANRNGTDPAAWAAEDLVRVHSLLDHSHTFPNAGGGRGINLTGKPITRLDLRVGGDARILVAANRADAIETAWWDGSVRLLSFEETAELLDIDLQISHVKPYTRVVLILSGDPAGQQALAQTIADRTGRLVYRPSHDLSVSNADANGASQVFTADPSIEWLLTKPYRPNFRPIPLPSGAAAEGTNVPTEFAAAANSGDASRMDPSNETGEVPDRATTADRVSALLAAQPDRPNPEDVHAAPEIRAALDVLKKVVPEKERAADGTLSWDGLDRLARELLGLTADTSFEDSLTALFLMAGKAQRAGWVHNLPALNAFVLGTQGAYGMISMVFDTGHSAVGRNWNRDLVLNGWNPKSVAVHWHSDPALTAWHPGPGLPRHTPTGSVTVPADSFESAPWPPGTFSYHIRTDTGSMEGDPEQYQITTSRGDRWISAAVLAELIAQDPVRPHNRQLLLLGPQQLDTARAVANAIGQPVWSATGETSTHHDPTHDTTYPVRVDNRNGGKPLGDWVVSPPGLLPPPDSEGAGQYLYEPDGTPHWVPDTDLITYPIIDPHTHESIGRARHRQTTMVDRAYDYGRIPSQQFSYFYDSAYSKSRERGYERTPWADLLPSGGRMYVFAGHGERFGRFWWPVRLGSEVKTLWGTPRSASHYLKRRPSLGRMREHAPGREVPILAMVCFAGKIPRGTLDLAASGSPAQILAEGTDAPVYAGSTSVGTAWRKSTASRLYTRTETTGELKGWVEYRPMPAEASLKTLALTMGLHTGTEPLPKSTADTTVRLVRILRQLFGTTAEHDTTLVEGIGALERLRRTDPQLASPGPFTLSFLTYATAVHNGDPRTELTTGRYRALLTDAAQWNRTATDTIPAAALTTHLPPSPDERLIDEVLMPVAADRKKLPLAERRGPEEERRALAHWSLARASFAVSRLGLADDLVRRVLHLGTDQSVTETDRNRLLVRAAQSFATDRGVNIPAAWAAQDLVWSVGLLNKPTALTTTAGGYCLVLTGSPFTGLNPDTRGAAYFLIAKVRRDSVSVTWPDGSRRRLPFDEVAELIDTHLHLLCVPPSTSIALAVSGNADGRRALAQAIANRTGCLVYRPTNPAGLKVTGPRADGEFMLTLVDPPAITQKINWLKTEPERPHFQSITPPGTVSDGSAGLTQFTDEHPRDRMTAEGNDNGDQRNRVVLADEAPAGRVQDGDPPPTGPEAVPSIGSTSAPGAPRPYGIPLVDALLTAVSADGAGLKAIPMEVTGVPESRAFPTGDVDALYGWAEQRLTEVCIPSGDHLLPTPRGTVSESELLALGATRASVTAALFGGDGVPLEEAGLSPVQLFRLLLRRSGPEPSPDVELALAALIADALKLRVAVTDRADADSEPVRFGPEDGTLVPLIRDGDTYRAAPRHLG